MGSQAIFQWVGRLSIHPLQVGKLPCDQRYCSLNRRRDTVFESERDGAWEADGNAYFFEADYGLNKMDLILFAMH